MQIRFKGREIGIAMHAGRFVTRVENDRGVEELMIYGTIWWSFDGKRLSYAYPSMTLRNGWLPRFDIQ